MNNHSFFWLAVLLGKENKEKKNVNNDFGLQICISSFGTAILNLLLIFCVDKEVLDGTS